jgi:hypothetical protein
VAKSPRRCDIAARSVIVMANGSQINGSPEVRTGIGQTAYKRELAYRRLGISPQQVQRIPFLRADLVRIARLLNKGRANDESPVRFLDLLQYSENPEAVKVLSVYRSVPESYRKLLPAEAFCCAAGVSPYRILEFVAAAAVRQGAMASAVIAAIQHPSVVAKTIYRALEPDGVQDRMMIHKAMGFLPIRG